MHLGRKRAMARDLVSFEPVVAGRHQVVERRAQVGVSAATVLLHARNLLLVADFGDLGIWGSAAGANAQNISLLGLGFGVLGSWFWVLGV